MFETQHLSSVEMSEVRVYFPLLGGLFSSWNVLYFLRNIATYKCAIINAVSFPAPLLYIKSRDPQTSLLSINGTTVTTTVII